MIGKKRVVRKKRLFIVAIMFIAIIIVGGSAYGSYSYLSIQQENRVKKQLEDARIAATKAEAVAKAIIEAKKKEPVYINLPGAKKIRAIVEDYSLPNSLWAIASKTHEIPIDYIPTPIEIPDVETRTDKSDDERSVRSDIATPIKEMFTQASIEGHSLMIGSGYRSATLQQIYFDNLAKSVGIEAANQAIAQPGQSEHQTGLAIDISTLSQQCYLSECFATTADGLWLAENSYKFGFILRYPEGKESITGYQYEPWHFRYVGIDLATALYESNLTLDEAWSYLETARNTLHKNGAI
jgi:D-alanyl-D-alanine carboxypeptidase